MSIRAGDETSTGLPYTLSPSSWEDKEGLLRRARALREVPCRFWTMEMVAFMMVPTLDAVIGEQDSI